MASNLDPARLAPMPPAMVLAAGLGTRLRPLTDLLPKPLVPVGDRPALGHVLARLRAAGVARVVVNAHHHAEQIAAAVAREPGEVLVSREPELLGTAGGLAHAAGLLGAGDVLVCNADVLADVDLAALVAAHAASATMVVQARERGAGSVGLDGAGRVVRLRARSFGEEAAGGDYLGTCVLGASLRSRLPAAGCLVGDVLIPALERGEDLRAWRYDRAWNDIGTLAGYLAANLAWLEAAGLPAWVGPGARVDAGVVLDRVVVGAGASVTGQGRLSRCVVWPGAHAEAPLEGQVVTS